MIIRRDECGTHVQRVAYPQNFITDITFKEIKWTTKILVLKILGYTICYVEYMWYSYSYHMEGNFGGRKIWLIVC